MPKPFIRHEESIQIAKLMACMAILFIQPEGGCCHPPLADSAFRVPPVPGRRAPGSIEKINLSCSSPQDSAIIPYSASKWQERGMGNGEVGNGEWVMGKREEGATRDHETRRLAERRSAAGMARRRLDLKVAVVLHSPFPFSVPLRATFVKRRRAIPTFGSRQAPRHEPGYARHEYTRILALRKQLSYHPMFRRGIRLRRRRQVGRRAKRGALRSKVARARATQPPASLAVLSTDPRHYSCLTAKA